LKNDLVFYVENVGTAPILVNGTVIEFGEITYLRDYALLEFGTLSMVFHPNKKLLARVANEMKRLGSPKEKKRQAVT
jgi:hypothetical protein